MPNQPETERRRHPRIQLKAFGLDHSCTVRMGTVDRDARIVDISTGGARLRMATATNAPEKGQTLTVDTRFKNVAREDAVRTGIVRWTQGSEFGIAFDLELPFGTAELQRMLDL